MKQTIKTIAALISLISAGSALADTKGVNFVADAALGIKQVEFDIRNDTGVETTVTPTFLTLGISLGLVASRFYVNINAENSLFDDEIEDAVFTGDIDKFSREDRNITIGYYIKDNISIFGGYLTGETTDKYSNTDPARDYQGTITLSENGPFIGANYAFLFRKSALSINGAYAYLDGEYTDTFTQFSGNNPGTSESKFEGDTTGFSLGVKYTHQITPGFNFFGSGIVRFFEFDGKEVGVQEAESFQTEENFYIINGGLSYAF